jgi:hypothetical protein
MALSQFEEHLKAKAFFHSESTFAGHPAVIGYEKQFRWSWSRPFVSGQRDIH